MSQRAYPGEFFLESEIDRPSANDSKFHIIPFPFEASVSYMGGTDGGPEAILQASQQLELFDGLSCPSDEGIFTAEAIDCSFDGSDQAIERIFADAGHAVSRSIEMGAVPVTLGGEHSISYAPIRALADHLAKQGAGPVGIVQIDAHADLRLAYQGHYWSHASVMRRCADEGHFIHQLGIRALCLEEHEYRRNNPRISGVDGPQLVPSGQLELKLPEDFPRHVYLTIDVDGLDPSIMPNTGTPVPGGLAWYQTLGLIQSLINQRDVLAFDLVELAPRQGQVAPDFLCTQLLYNIFGMIQRKN